VSDPAGKLIAKGSLGEEEILLADLDLSSIDVQRTHWPFLRDRRVDAYAELTKRFID
jgi:N-carbamoylputrescine amidase